MIADILVIAVVVLFISIGYKAGLMRSLIKIVSYILSIIAAFLMFPVVSDFLMSTKLYTWLEAKVNESGIAINFSQNESTGFWAKYLSEGAEGINNGISAAVTQLLVSIAAFILVLLISKLVMHVICKILNVFSKLPVINQFNRIGGAALGGVIGVIVLYIVFAGIVFFAPFEENGRVIKELEKSSFAGEMYENNILLDLIQGTGGANGKD